MPAEHPDNREDREERADQTNDCTGPAGGFTGELSDPIPVRYTRAAGLECGGAALAARADRSQRPSFWIIPTSIPDGRGLLLTLGLARGSQARIVPGPRLAHWW